jgi:hypothetical protein
MEVRQRMTVELLVDLGQGQARLATIRLAASRDWMLLGGEIARGIPLGKGPVPRPELVQAVALTLSGGPATLEAGPLMVQTPAP